MARRILLMVLQVLLIAAVVSCGSSSVAVHPSPFPSPSPRPSPSMTAADKGTLALLEARPLKLPTLLAGGVCRPDSQDATLGLWGADPVYVEGGPQHTLSYGDYFSVSGMTKPGLIGPVLLRGHDLKAPNHPIVFVSPYGVGAVYGTDPTYGTQYTELALDTTHPTDTTYPINGVEYVHWYWTQGIALGWTGCIGFQIDGPTFSDAFNVNVTPRP